MCERMKSFQFVVCVRFGAGAIPCRRRTLPMVWSETSCPTCVSATRNPVVARAGILASEAEDESFNFRTDSWPARIRPAPGAIELRGNESPIPSQNHVGFRDARDIGQSLPSQLAADLR